MDEHKMTLLPGPNFYAAMRKMFQTNFIFFFLISSVIKVKDSDCSSSQWRLKTIKNAVQSIPVITFISDSGWMSDLIFKKIHDIGILCRILFVQTIIPSYCFNKENEFLLNRNEMRAKYEKKNMENNKKIEKFYIINANRCNWWSFR